MKNQNIVEMDYYSTFRKQVASEGIDYIANQVDFDVAPVDCLRFIAELHRQFESERSRLLEERVKQSAFIINGGQLSIPSDTEHIRSDTTWRIPEIPAALLDRRVDIVCMDTSYSGLVKCMESGANGVQVDFDDGFQCGWQNVRMAHTNLKNVIAERIERDSDALLLVRPRSLNLSEFHVLVDGTPVSGSLFDFGVHMYHSAKLLQQRGRGPYFYIPKIESRHEALWWNKVITFTEQRLGLPYGSCKTIVLIENIQAAFEMTEIIYYLRDHIVALNTGRWDYIFSVVKSTISNKSCDAFPERNQLGLNQEFLMAYYKLLVAIAHSRGALATGGMAPIYRDGSLTPEDLDNVFNGKLTEAEMCFDGALVAHPGAVESCRKAFSPKPDMKFSSLVGDFWNYHKSLLAIPKGDITTNGLESSISVLVHYILKWVSGEGAVPLDGIVEDLATAEINRALLWRWIKSHIKTREGTLISLKLVLNRAREIATKTNTSQCNYLKLERIICILLHSNSFVDFMPSIMYPFVTSIQLESPL